MNLTKWHVFSICILLFIVIIGVLWVITTDSISWPGFFSIVIAVIGALGTFLSWLFPFPHSTDKIPTSSNDSKQNSNQGIIITDPFQRQKLEEQKTQVIIQRKREKHRKRKRVIISISSATVSVISIAVFIFLQSSSQVRFITEDTNYEDLITSIAWSPNGQYVASAVRGGDIRIWNIARNETFFVYQSPTDFNGTYNMSTGVFNNLSWSPDGKYIAFGENDHQVRVVNVSNRSLYSFDVGNSTAINTVMWAPHTDFLAFGGDNNTIYIAQWRSMQMIRIRTYANGSPVTSLAWSPDGKLIGSGGSDGKIHVWNTVTGKEIFKSLDSGAIVSSLTWSPTSSSLLASASSNLTDSQVHIWDIAKRTAENPITTYKEHRSGVNGIAWFPNGKDIASVGDDGTLRIWDAMAGGDVGVYQDYVHPALNNSYVNITAVGLSSDAKSIAIGHYEHERGGGPDLYTTVKVVKFCRSWCLFH